METPSTPRGGQASRTKRSNDWVTYVSVEDMERLVDAMENPRPLGPRLRRAIERTMACRHR